MKFLHTSYAQRLRFGAGAVAQVGEAAAELEAARVLLVTTSARRASAAGLKVAQGLGSLLATVFDGVRSHVPEAAVQAAIELARRERIDTVVSFGGGSCADLGKAVCLRIEQQDGAPGGTCFARPRIPHIAIPTAYSGAEVTAFFGVTDEATRRKTRGGSPTSAPAAVIYDPELTLDLPARVSAETGMNALAHCVEGAWSATRSAEAEAIGFAGAARIYRALPRVCAEPADLAARSDMLAGAMLGGRCLQNATMGIHHGLSQMIGARSGIAHGLANALILAHVVRFNAQAARPTMQQLAVAFGRADGDVAAAIDELRARLQLPARLSQCGVSAADIEAVVRASVGNPYLANNPRPVGEAEVRAILGAAF